MPLSRAAWVADRVVPELAIVHGFARRLLVFAHTPGVRALTMAAEQLTNSPEQAIYVGRAGLQPETNGL